MYRHCLLLAAALSVTVSLSSAPAHSQEQRFSGQTLRVAGYGGGSGRIIRQAVSPTFEKLTGAKIEWSEGTPTDFTAQLMAAKGGEPPYDVVFIEDIVEPQAMARGIISKLNMKNIPNEKFVQDRAKTPDGYSIAWGFFRLGIAYLPQKLKAAGIAPPKDLSIIFDPRLAGHIALPDINQTNWPNFMPTAAAFLGNPINEPNKTIDKLASIKGASLFSSSSDMETRMTSGETWVSLWIDGRVNQLKLKGLDIEFAPMGVPDGKGGHLNYTAVLGLMSVSNPKKQELAEIFINTMLATPVATEIALKSTYAPSNSEAQKAIKADAKLGPLVDTDITKQFVPDFHSWPPVEHRWIDVWGKAFRK